MSFHYPQGLGWIHRIRLDKLEEKGRVTTQGSSSQIRLIAQGMEKYSLENTVASSLRSNVCKVKSLQDHSLDVGR